MKPHVKNYFKHFGYGEQDVILCEVCHKVAVDCHHVILRSQGGSDEVKNIIALCRKCHDKAHAKTLTESDLQYIHNNVLMGNNKQFMK